MPNLYSGNAGRPVFVGTLALLAAAILLYSLVRTRVARVIAFAMAGASVAIGIAINISWGAANIDVFQFQQASSQAVLHGQNPYSPIVRSPELVPPGVLGVAAPAFPVRAGHPRAGGAVPPAR